MSSDKPEPPAKTGAEVEEDQDTADEDVKEADIIEPAEPNLSKSLDTKATLASAIIAADSVLVAGQSFFMFQMAPDKPAWIAFLRSLNLKRVVDKIYWTQ